MFGVEDKFLYKNGKTLVEKNEKIEKNFSHFLHKITINEWTFSLFLFVMSLTIVAVKLAVMYGILLPTKTYDLVKTPSQSLLGGFIPEFDKDNYLFNATREYKETLIDTVTQFIGKFGWFLKAAVSGLSLMGFTWFIVYKDSRIPGVNPPSPFSPGKRKFHDESRLQMNYVIGIINGILIFIYMCF
ncbi:uncharacterized protein LOC135160317 [Diachasmimorpha longicaudata]|uniref:uncharacterized protein LOC135160317 n=1 Tax=Diachasmimorpha longicaudata TaxID=58733 RepID=UPI0030B8E017